VLAWGCNKSSQLGLGDGFSTLVPYPTHIPGLHSVRLISCGSEHSAALLYDCSVYTWGQGEGGILGHGSTDSSNLPKKVSSLDSVSVVQIYCGGLHTLALTDEGHVYSWGRGEGGQLGHPLQLLDSSRENELFICSPVQVKFTDKTK
jgi:alpha-tubulin suppressor-like RCC1 family protein